MKKFIIALIAVFALSTAAMAQGNSEKYAIGLRLGGGYGYGVEASFHLGGLPVLFPRACRDGRSREGSLRKYFR